MCSRCADNSPPRRRPSPSEASLFIAGSSISWTCVCFNTGGATPSLTNASSPIKITVVMFPPRGSGRHGKSENPASGCFLRNRQPRRGASHETVAEIVGDGVSGSGPERRRLVRGTVRRSEERPRRRQESRQRGQALQDDRRGRGRRQSGRHDLRQGRRLCGQRQDREPKRQDQRADHDLRLEG